MPKIIRVNTRTKEVTTEDMGDYAGLGGRALTSRIVKNEVPATCHALSADNKLVVATGLLTGTRAANSGRASVGAKSPLTGGIKESNSGGNFSQKMARLDIMAIVLEDKPEADAPLSYLKITDNGVEFADASATAGKGTYDSAQALLDDDKAAALLIGPGGEQCLAGASVQFTDTRGRPARAAGRGGMGAVMGSKRIKAMVVDDAGANKIEYADDDRFKKAAKRWVEILQGHPVTSQGLPEYGTAILINIINEAGALPTKNFREGRFEYAADVSGEKMTELMKTRGGKHKEGCHAGCIIQCSNTFVDKDGEYLTSGLEYETVWAMGPNTLIRDIDALARLDHVCDDLGLDTIEMGNTIAVAMEAGLVEWGDAEGAIGLIKRVADATDPLGHIVGNGAAFLGRAYGIERVAEVKGQSLPAYDPRSVKGVGVTYATTPMGADHTAGYGVCQNILKVGGDVDPCASSADQIDISKNLQIATAAVDSAGLCLFVAFAVLDTEDAMQTICEMLSARGGAEVTPDDVVGLGQAVLRDELAFNEAAGFSKADDQLPGFFAKEKLPPHGTSWDYSIEDLQKAKV
jgi:aldehyde:ferredoxin oxidoreductase